MGIGIPYNSSLISKKEIMEIGNALKNINPYIQVCVLDYRPEFKRMDLKKPDFNEMKEIKGRHDPCICPRVVPVAEATVAMVMIDHLIRSGFIHPCQI